jgi:hypothetical protein
MKAMKKIRYAILALAALVAAACSTKEFDEITDLNLNRCLSPMDLNARVSATLGDVVTFSWAVAKDADAYILTVYTDEALTQQYLQETVLPSQVPYQKKLEADKTYWFTVQAISEGKEPSKVVWNEKSFKTFAVKDNLFLKVTDRTATSVSLAWSKDVADFTDVDRIEYGAPGEDPAGSVTLTASEIAAAAATVDGLTPSTEYVFTLYYLSASRGQVDAWTTPDVNGTTEVSTTDALLNAVKTAGAKILLKMEGSPYDIEALDISNGFTLLGEESADGSKPVVQGEFHFADTWAPGTDLFFEGVDFDGGPTAASPSGFGFAIQNKNGGTVKDKNIGNVTYRNCIIRNYTKGLIYEWGNNMVLGEVTYDGCDIHDINTDGTVGGDVFDIRQATTVAKLAFVNNTIWQGMRTFVRFDAGTLGALVFENNTLQNLNFVDNTNNAGVFGLQITPGSFSFKNNLFLNFTGKAVLAGANAKYVPAGDMGVAAANNWFYNLPKNDAGSVIYFTDNFTQAQAAGSILEADPCYNAPGGFFNLLADSEIADKKVGAPKWWTPFVEEPEDLTLNLIEGNKTWNLANAKFFSGSIKKQMVRDDLFVSAGESNAIVVDGGKLNFQTAGVTNRQGVPTLSYLAFKVNRPGSVLVKAADPENQGNHFIVGVGPVDGSSIALKGGVSAMADMTTPTKILITTITEESLVYVFPSGPVALEKLAWSTDVTPVNTALPTPAPKADPSAITAGDAADITVSWEPVENAGSYSVVFNGKSNTVSEGTEFVIGGTTTGMLDAGSYKVEVYANPMATDIYNTESAAGVAAFAVLPKGGGGEDAELVVTNVDQLLSAIAAGKEAITLAPGAYDLGGVLTVAAPLALKGQPGAEITGAFKLIGEVGNFSVENLTVKAGGQGVFIDLDGDLGAKAESVTVKNTVIDGFGKSVIYASNKADLFSLGDILFQAVEVYNHGTSQGMFDLRNGAYNSFRLIESTLTGGRDFLRIDATCSIPTVYVGHNTMYNLNTSKNGNGIFYVRASASDYKVEKNLLLGMTSGTVIGKSGAQVPKMVGNYYYDCNDEVFFTGIMDKEEALGGQGVILTVDPVKDAPSLDFTLVNGVVISAGVGAPKWNPSVVPASDGATMTVASADEFQAAVDAGKTDITFAAGSYDLSAANVTLTAGMRLSGEPGAEITVNQFDLAEGELGNVLIENLKINGSANNLISVGAASVVNNLTLRNCEINGVGKSILYGNAEGSSFAAVVISNNVMTGLGGGQGTIDIRKGVVSALTIDNNTIVGGRDFIRADKNTVTAAVNIVNNTFDGVTLNNGNGVLYVRATPDSYVLKNNLFLNENGDNNLLSKASGITVPTAVASNFFYNCVAEKFWTGLIDQEMALANGGVILSADPVKDAANGDYTLVDALCLSSNVGAARWNPNAGRVSSEITVASVAELTTAIDAGKAAITLKAGVYDLAEVAESRVITLIAPLALTGQGSVEIVGGFKFGAGTTSFAAENIKFSGAEKAVGNAFEIAEAVEMSAIRLTGCDIYAYNKSLFYGNGADSRIAVFDFQKNLVHGFGTGQGMIDIRKGAYTAINVSKNTFYDGGRDFIRCDKDIAGSIAITNNTFAACSIDAGNGLLWVRSCADAPQKYNVAKNLFLNLTGEKTVLAKSGATVPTMNGNFFFNVGPAFWGGAIDQATATVGGALLEADPCAGSAEFNFKLTDAAVRAADAGDPRWNSASPNYTKKR